MKSLFAEEAQFDNQVWVPEHFPNVHQPDIYDEMFYHLHLQRPCMKFSYQLQINMSSLPTGCCAIQWAMWKGGGLTSCDRLNSSENYLLLGFLLAMPSQTVLLLVRKSLT